MEWLSALFGIGGSTVAGGLVGALGAAFARWQERLDAKDRRAHELAMRDKDLVELDKEADLALKKANIERATRVELAATEAETTRELDIGETMRASMTHDAASYSRMEWVGAKLRGAWGVFAALLLVLVDVARGLIRPTTTVYTLGVQSFVAFALFELLKSLQGATLTADQTYGLLQVSVQSINFLASTCVVWWFGVRPLHGGRP